LFGLQYAVSCTIAKTFCHSGERWVWSADELRGGWALFLGRETCRAEGITKAGASMAVTSMTCAIGMELEVFAQSRVSGYHGGDADRGIAGNGSNDSDRTRYSAGCRMNCAAGVMAVVRDDDDGMQPIGSLIEGGEVAENNAGAPRTICEVGMTVDGGEPCFLFRVGSGTAKRNRRRRSSSRRVWAGRVEPRGE